MKKTIHQPKIHYYILLLIVFCPCLYAAAEKKADGGNSKQPTNGVHKAAIDGNMDYFSKLPTESITQSLNTKDESDNWTPLHYATAHNQKDIVAFILNQPRITVNAKTKNKESTALHILIENKNFDLLDCFIAYKQKQKAQTKKFTRLLPKTKDKDGQIPSYYFPKGEDIQIGQYKKKWDELVGNLPKKSKALLQNGSPSIKQGHKREITPTAPLPTGIDMADSFLLIQNTATQSSHNQAAPPSTTTSSRTKSNDISIPSPVSADEGHALAPNKAMNTSKSTTTQPRKSQVKQKRPKAKSSPAYQPSQKAMSTTAASLNFFDYLQYAVISLLLVSIIYLIAMQLKCKIRRK